MIFKGDNNFQALFNESFVNFIDIVHFKIENNTIAAAELMMRLLR